MSQKVAAVGWTGGLTVMRENCLGSHCLDDPVAHHSALLHDPDKIIPVIQVANSASILPAEAVSQAYKLAVLTLLV